VSPGERTSTDTRRRPRVTSAFGRPMRPMRHTRARRTARRRPTLVARDADDRGVNDRTR